jgi:subtilisin family serine protease
MKRLLAIAALLSFGLVAGCQDSSSPVEAGSPQSVTTSLSKHTNDNDEQLESDGYIVVLDDNVSASDVQSVASELGRKHKGSVGKTFKHVIKGFSMRLSDADLEQLKKDRRVRYVEPDYIVSVEPGVSSARTSGKKSGGSNTTSPTSPTGSTTPWGITRVGGSHDGTGKTVWIIDTGVDLYNPDLNVDLTRSINFVGDGHTTAQDGHSHGTHVAGTVAARNNSIGVTGVAANATIVAVRVLGDNGLGNYSTIISGIDYVAANAEPGDVANLSLGGGVSLALDSAVIRAAARGIRFAIAAGNNSTSATTNSPARVEYPNVYTVSAIDQNGYFASFSNYGNPPIDFAAPGVNIESTAIGGGTIFKSGTSMAAPHVAGLLLLNSLNWNGTARNDPDGSADRIAHY